MGADLSSDQPFEVTVRVVLLRLVCYVALLLSILVLLEKKYLLFLLVVLTIIHHVLTLIGPRLRLPRLLDLLFTFLEMIYMPLTYVARFNKWMSRSALFSNFMQWTLFSLLAISAGSKIRDVIKYNPYEKYDIRRTQSDIPHHLNGYNTEVLHTVRDVFIGRAAWEAQFRGEPKWIILSRGVLAASIIIVISIFACYNVVLETVRQAALTPANELRAMGVPWDFTTTQAPAWNVIFTRLTDGRDNVSFPSALQVTPLRSLGKGASDTPCSWHPELEVTDPITELPYIEQVAFHCLSRIPIAKDELFHLYSHDIMPDLLITVNFTLLNISVNTVMDTPTNSVQFVVGLTNDTRAVLQTTFPTTLIPGVNLIGMIRFNIRQILSSSVLAAIGLFDTHETFLVSEIIHVWPDPRASTSAMITQAPDIATIRLSPQVDPSEWRVIQERRDKSIVRGLSSAGGLWTALGGILSIFFGSSIMRLMFGVKPLSIFGLAHKVQSPKIRDACLNEYPHITLDVNDIQQADRGIISLMCDHLIDVDHFIEERVAVDDQAVLQLLPLVHRASPISLDGER